jgi:ethanolamine utilization protein EutQ (cupin superfamily)
MSIHNLVRPSLVILACILFSSIAFADGHEHKMKTFKNAQGMTLAPMDIEGKNAYLSDIVSSNDPDSPITCGLFRMEKGDPLTYTYTYDEAKIIIEGEMTIAEKGGETFEAVAGDIIFFDKGATITFTSKSYGIGFICGQRAVDEF